MERRLQWHRKGRSIGTWQLDETYIKVKGVWKYLYRAIDSKGNTLDFYLSHTRNTKAAYRFLRKVLGKFKSYEQPTKINTDKNPSYGAALKLLKKEGKCNRSSGRVRAPAANIAVINWYSAVFFLSCLAQIYHMG